MFLFSTSYIESSWCFRKKFKLGEWEREQTLSGFSSHPAFGHLLSIAVLFLWLPCFSTSIVAFLFITKLKSPLLFWILSRDQTPPGERASTEQCTQCHRPQPGQLPLCAGSILAPSGSQTALVVSGPRYRVMYIIMFVWAHPMAFGCSTVLLHKACL